MLLSPSLRWCVALACCLAWAPVAAADAPARYNDQVASPARTELERKIEALAGQVALTERRTAPRAEPHLQRAAASLAESLGAGPPPSNDLVDAALRLNGVVEPPPHLIMVSAGADGDRAVLEELNMQFPRALASGRYSRVAAAAITRGDHLYVLVMLQESFIELDPVPRSLPSGGPTALKGRLLGTFEHPSAFVTTPEGRAEPMQLGGDAKKFTGTFRCGPSRGRYQVELTGEDRFGTTVLANFPVYCGQPAPQILVAPTLPAEAPVADAAGAERAALSLVNADRTRAGLRALKLDARLSDVARAHCRDMQAHGFVGHVSPTTGSPGDRVSRAKIPAAMVLENVARATTPGEVERGLMESPGHRRNILSKEAERIGIGAVLSESVGESRELLVTQLFIVDEQLFHPSNAADLAVRVTQLRRKQGLADYLPDAELDHIADGVARDLATGRATPQSSSGPLDRAIAHLGGRYRSVRSLFAVATQIEQVVEALKEPLGVKGPIAIGIALQPGVAARVDGKPDEGHLAHHAVVLVAVPR